MADVHTRVGEAPPPLPDIPKQRFLKKTSGHGVPNFDYLKNQMREKIRNTYSKSKSPERRRGGPKE